MDIPQPMELNGLTEMECEAGHHHVLDPAEMTRIMKQRRFRCDVCRVRKSIDELVAFIMYDSGLKGQCAACDLKLIREGLG